MKDLAIFLNVAASTSLPAIFFLMCSTAFGDTLYPLCFVSSSSNLEKSESFHTVHICVQDMTYMRLL